MKMLVHGLPFPRLTYIVHMSVARLFAHSKYTTLCLIMHHCFSSFIDHILLLFTEDTRFSMETSYSSYTNYSRTVNTLLTLE